MGSQEGRLFSGTIFDNIAEGIVALQEEGVPVAEELVIAAAKDANAHNFIMDFPDGYQTEVGESGSSACAWQGVSLETPRCFCWTRLHRHWITNPKRSSKKPWTDSWLNRSGRPLLLRTASAQYPALTTSRLSIMVKLSSRAHTPNCLH